MNGLCGFTKHTQGQVAASRVLPQASHEGCDFPSSFLACAHFVKQWMFSPADMTHNVVNHIPRQLPL